MRRISVLVAAVRGGEIHDNGKRPSRLPSSHEAEKVVEEQSEPPPPPPARLVNHCHGAESSDSDSSSGELDVDAELDAIKAQLASLSLGSVVDPLC